MNKVKGSVLYNGKYMGFVGAKLTMFWILAPTFTSCAIFDKVLISFTVKMEINLPSRIFKED